MWCHHGYQFVLDELQHANYSFLEIGVLDGDLFSSVAREFPDRNSYGIDPFVNPGDITRETGVAPGKALVAQQQATHNNIRGLANAVLFETTSREFSETLTTDTVEQMNIGIVLIDGSSDYEDVLNDLQMSVRLIGDKKGSIILDDVGLPSIAQARDTFLKLHGNKVTSSFVLKQQSNIQATFGTFDIYTMVFRLN